MRSAPRITPKKSLISPEKSVMSPGTLTAPEVMAQKGSAEAMANAQTLAPDGNAKLMQPAVRTTRPKSKADLRAIPDDSKLKGLPFVKSEGGRRGTGKDGQSGHVKGTWKEGTKEPEANLEDMEYNSHGHIGHDPSYSTHWEDAEKEHEEEEGNFKNENLETSPTKNRKAVNGVRRRENVLDGAYAEGEELSPESARTCIRKALAIAFFTMISLYFFSSASTKQAQWWANRCDGATSDFCDYEENAAIFAILAGVVSLFTAALLSALCCTCTRLWCPQDVRASMEVFPL